MNDPQGLTQQQVAKPRLTQAAASFHQRMTGGEIGDLGGAYLRLAAFLYRALLLFIDGVGRTELPRRAAALTYTTILSIFPLLAVISATASYFYTEDAEQGFMIYIERQFFPATLGETQDLPIPFAFSADEREALHKQQQAVVRLREAFTGASQKFRDNAGGVGIFGFLGLLIAAGILYYSIESVVNQTWQTERGGDWGGSLTKFVMTLFLANILLGLSIATTTLAVTLFDKDIETELAEAPGEEASLPASMGPEEEPAEAPDEGPPVAFVGPPTPGAEMGEAVANAVDAIATGATTVAKKKPLSKTMRTIRKVTAHFEFLLKVLPILINTVMLSIAYSFLPRTRVQFGYALLGALVASVIWEAAKHLFIFYVWVSSTNQSLADAFGVVVIFLIWIYLTWLILLFGNLVVYTSQNFRSLWLERVTGRDVAVDSRLHLALMLLLARRFLVAGGGYTEMELRVRLGLNGPDFQQVMDRLRRDDYVTISKDDHYLLNHPPDQIKARDILKGGCNLTQLPVTRQRRSTIGRLFTDLEERASSICEDMNLQQLLEDSTVLGSDGRETRSGGTWLGADSEFVTPSPANEEPT